MATRSFGVSRVWIGETSDPPQYLSLLCRRIATMGGSFRNEFTMRFETLRFKDRHIASFAKLNEQQSKKHNSTQRSNGNSQHNPESMTSALFSVSNSIQKTRIVPKHCVSVLQHSKHCDSQFVLFDNDVLCAADLVTAQLIDPFKLNKKSKAMNVNGECYQWGDFLIYFGQISKHSSPADFVVVEIEYQCLHSLNDGNANRILQEVFHFIITPIPKTIGSSQRVTATQTDLEKTMDVDVDANDSKQSAETANSATTTVRSKETKSVFVELSNEKGEKIRWRTPSAVPFDFSTLNIPQSTFDGRHLAVLYATAFSKVQD